MIICYCIDKNYCYYAKVSIESYKRYNPDAKIIVVSEKELPKDIGYDENVIIKLPKVYRNRGKGDRITNCAYLRLFLTDLPYDKVLYVDADTICQKPLDDLWNMKPEYICLTESYTKRQAIGLGLEKYGLSNMLLMNLKALRDIGFTKKCIEFLENNTIPDELFQHDETTINMVLKDRLEFLPLKFNYCHNREYEMPIDENDAYILHYIGSDKIDMINGKRYPELYFLEDEIKGKSIAIVGNAQMIFDKNNGKQIDNHDFVIRFNHGVPKDRDSQGSKTDLVILACNLSDEEISEYNSKYFVNRSMNCFDKSADITIGARERCIMAHSLDAQPSSGFMAVNICLTFGAKKIDLYGFDGSGISYPNDPKYKTQHDMKKELEIYKGYEAVGLLKIHK